MDRILGAENVWVLGLLVVAVLVGIGARCGDDPRRARAATLINRTIRVAFAVLAAAVVLFLAVLILVRADVVMMTSALLRHGLERVGTVEAELC